jgi:hypothetical protein
MLNIARRSGRCCISKQPRIAIASNSGGQLRSGAAGQCFNSARARTACTVQHRTKLRQQRSNTAWKSLRGCARTGDKEARATHF